MPTNRRRRKTARKQSISTGLWAWLNDAPIPQEDSDAKFEALMLECSHANAFRNGADKLRELWASVRDDLLGLWVQQRPGTRPRLWWEFECPRQPEGRFGGCFYDGRLPEQRLHVGGAGRPAHEISAIMPDYSLGIPSTWTGFDARRPPVFESQPAFLKRNGLLAAAEARRLRKVDYEPETITQFKHGFYEPHSELVSAK